jgi:hypothetical protein
VRTPGIPCGASAGVDGDFGVEEIVAMLDGLDEDEDAPEQQRLEADHFELQD